MMVDVWVLHQCGNHKRIALKCLVKRFLHKYRAELVTFNEEMQFKKNFFYLVSYWLMGISWGKDMRAFFRSNKVRVISNCPDIITIKEHPH